MYRIFLEHSSGAELALRLRAHLGLARAEQALGHRGAARLAVRAGLAIWRREQPAELLDASPALRHVASELTFLDGEPIRERMEAHRLIEYRGDPCDEQAVFAWAGGTFTRWLNRERRYLDQIGESDEAIGKLMDAEQSIAAAERYARMVLLVAERLRASLDYGRTHACPSVYPGCPPDHVVWPLLNVGISTLEGALALARYHRLYGPRFLRIRETLVEHGLPDPPASAPMFTWIPPGVDQLLDRPLRRHAYLEAGLALPEPIRVARTPR